MAPDGCNTCVCGNNGREVCTEKICPVQGCRVGDMVYRPGQSFPHPDGCNTCVCHSNGAAGLDFILLFLLLYYSLAGSR